MRAALHVVMGIACVGLCGVARADVVKLAELEARAIARRPELAVNQARIRQAGAELDLANSAYWPTVAANVDASLAPGRELLEIPIDGRTYLVSGSAPFEESRAFLPLPRYGASVQARGNLYDFGRTSAAVDAARAKERASQADAEARAQALVLEVRAAYLRWSVAQALWEIAEEANKAARARAERIAGLIAEGAAPAAAQTPAALAANAAASEAERAALELESARLELGFVSAQDLGPDARPEPELLAPAAPPPSASEPAGDGPVVAALESARVAAEARQRAQAKANAPVIGYRLNAGIEAQLDDFLPNFGVGIGLSVPLWDGGATAASEAAARAAAAELSAQATVERARQKHAGQRRTLQLASATRLLALAQEALALADARVKQLEAGETLGNAAQDALAAADADRVRVQGELVRAQAAFAQLRLGL